MAAKKKTEEEEKEVDEKAPEEKKSPDDKRLTDLEKKLGEMSETINQQNEFIQGASTVINTLAYTPHLRQEFQKVYSQQQGVVPEGEKPVQQQKQEPQTPTTAGEQKGSNDELARKVDEVSVSRREEIIRNFEDRVGISKMKDDDRSQARKKLESYFNDFGMSVKTNPLTNLQGNLERAWIGTNADKLKEEGKLEGIAQFQANQQGAMGTISGTVPQSESDRPKLTEKQKEWADKLGVDTKKAEKTYISRYDEEKRVPESESKAKK